MAENKETNRGKITKDMPVQEILIKYPETISVFRRYGLHCIGCFAASFETLEQGALAHGLDIDKLLKDLNDSDVKKKE
ncbi:MAG: DUF1858 domain-containing protein [Candidatus Aenigmarchaeota archaeon]|nr:DUF1858 domain-containing protein [Candidatus Aenigmarchaeota archaeon]